MQQYSINDLPQFSAWPERLLSVPQNKKRTASENLREYEKEKFGPLLNSVLREASSRSLTIDDVIKMEVPGQPDKLCFSNQSYQLLSFEDSWNRNIEMVGTILKNYMNDDSALVELGAGYGRTLLSLKTKDIVKNNPCYGYEYTGSGAELLKFLVKTNNFDVHCGLCDFTSADIVDSPFPSDSVVFTYYAASCIPLLTEEFFRKLCSFAPSKVVHFEPCYEHCDDKTLRGLMNKKYIEVNDMNKNLLTQLKNLQKKGELRIIEEQREVFSRNPLLSCSIIVWEPIY